MRSHHLLGGGVVALGLLWGAVAVSGGSASQVQPEGSTGVATAIPHYHPVHVGPGEEGCPALPGPLFTTLAMQHHGDPDLRYARCVIGRTADGVPVSVMFDIHADERYVQHVMRSFAQTVAGNDMITPQYFAEQRWTQTAQQSNTGAVGNPVLLTYSYVPDNTTVPAVGGLHGATGSTLFASMDSKFGNNTALWQSKFTEIFDRWSELTGMTITREMNDDGAPISGAAAGRGVVGTRGDVRIASVLMDGPGGVLAYNYYPNHGDMVIDSAENWGNTSNNYRFLRNTLGHEHGHGLGFGHVIPCNQTKLMEPFLSTAYDMLQHDDIRGGQWFYGDPYELNNTGATATNLGILSVGTHNFNNASLRTTADVDWFRFETPANARVTITLTPTGQTYVVGNVSGSSCSGSTGTVNSLTLQNLGFELRSGANGVNVLQTVDSQPAGQAEVLSNYPLAGSGPFFVRVFGAGTNDVQMFNLQIQVLANPTITGSVALSDFAGTLSNIPLTFEIRDVGGNTPLETHVIFAQANGNYSFQTALTGNRDLLVKGPTWLRARRSNVNIHPTNGASGQAFVLVNGDVNGDNVVNVSDFLLLRNAFGSNSSSPNWNANADLNKDGGVNVTDFLILRNNLGQSGIP